jgi:hypothetical protein
VRGEGLLSRVHHLGLKVLLTLQGCLPVIYRVAGPQGGRSTAPVNTQSPVLASIRYTLSVPALCTLRCTAYCGH